VRERVRKRDRKKEQARERERERETERRREREREREREKDIARERDRERDCQAVTSRCPGCARVQARLVPADLVPAQVLTVAIEQLLPTTFVENEEIEEIEFGKRMRKLSLKQLLAGPSRINLIDGKFACHQSSVVQWPELVTGGSNGLQFQARLQK